MQSILNQETMYNDEELLMLSGIQHIAFCKRQWAFIHVEQLWIENTLTIEGQYLHRRVDNPFIKKDNDHVITRRAVSIVSRNLGLYGVADVVEFVKTDSTVNSVSIKGKNGRWHVNPIEYKRGRPKSDERDEVQLCAQAMCLEEMYDIAIHTGYLFYGETRHRVEIQFTEELRELVNTYAHQMHFLFKSGITPLPEYKKHCRSCSLYDICIPKAMNTTRKASQYINSILFDD